MIEIKGNSIRMTRGDSLVVIVTAKVKQTGEIYIPNEGDTFRFAVKHNRLNSDRSDFTDSAPLILKDIPADTMELILEPADTKSLEFGNYVYDIELTRFDGVVDTFIANANFTLTPEVH